MIRVIRVAIIAVGVGVFAIVINDGSKDGTAQVVRAAEARFPWLTFVDLQQNGGKARALNIGFKAVRHDLVITVDCGITAFAPLEAAKDAGLDVLVVDQRIASVCAS